MSLPLAPSSQTGATEPPLPASAATPPDEATVPTESEPVVVVRLGMAEFGLPIHRVREVLRTPPISRIPFPPPAVAGVTNIRGEVLPVLDLGVRLLGHPAEQPGRLVVVRTEETGPLALLVDSIAGIVAPEAAETREAPPEVEATLPPGWISVVVAPEAGRLVTVLHLDPVLAREGHA